MKVNCNQIIFVALLNARGAYFLSFDVVKSVWFTIGTFVSCSGCQMGGFWVS